MKKIISFLLCIMLVASLLLACSVEASASNRQLFDMTYQFDYVQIAMPDGTVVEGDVESWRDYENSDMIQVKVNGETYLTHSMNVILVAR